MTPVYAYEVLPTKMKSSIFLAGPTPRSKDVPSWRPEALKVLEDLGYDGHVFLPEPRDGVWSKEYDNQIDWEEAALNQSDCILFWVPRDLKTMPGFTTNDEWGFWKYSGKVVFGAPDTAEKVRYQEHYAKKYGVPMGSTLKDTLKLAMKMTSSGVLRVGGEVKVPLYVWNQPSFQSWYGFQSLAGNVLEHAQVLWQFTPPKSKKMFCWVLQVSVFVRAEGRRKTNEFVIGRPDISSVILWNRAATLGDTRVVLVREFRSPARTLDGYLREPPGGSSPDDKDPKLTAVEELEEETSFKINPNRLTLLGLRQLYGTLSSVGASVYAAEITDEELDYFLGQKGVAHGVEEATERTFLEVHRVSDLIQDPVTDWATLGMLFSAFSTAMR